VKVRIKKSTSRKFFEDDYHLQDLLTLSCAVTRANKGYIKKDAPLDKDKDEVTKKLPNLFVMANYMNIEKYSTKTYDNTIKKYYKNFSVLDKDSEEVERMIRYFKGLSMKAIKRNISDFESSILSMISKEYVSYKDIGIIASLPNVYANGQKQKQFNKLEKQLGQTSEHIGTLRERGDFNLEVVYVKFIWRSNSYLCVAKDSNDNIVKFFYNTKIAVGEKLHITAYVKDHTKGKMSGGAETYLNRVKIVE
tara:strand:+ start:234 stop:983 length:750 start_codon:yes stop_codon:yes gene_type:complete